jgi:hypothetical protein
MKNTATIRFHRNYFILLAIILFQLVTSSCKKEESPTVITHNVDLITSETAVIAGDVLSDGGAPVAIRGFAWGSDPMPDIQGNIQTEGSGEGFFKVTLSGLEAGMKYYVRAYAKNSSGLSYGNEVTFTTLESDPVLTADVIVLGPNSRVKLGVPVVSEVESVSSAYNNGPGTLSYLRIHSTYPVDRINQKVLEINFFPAGGQLITDDRRQPVIYHEFTNLAPGVSRVTGWKARVQTRTLEYEIDPDDVGLLTEIPSEIAQEYLADEDQYQITNPIVTNARDVALDGVTHPLDMTKNIFYWVRNHMTYETDHGWADAPTNISRAVGTCSDYAFVFIAMCRSAGLPARWTGAYVRRGSQNEPGPYHDEPNHRWAQVYLPRIGWVEMNVQGSSQWLTLNNSYLVVSESSGTSNYLGIRYDSYRRWGFGSGSGPLELERYAVWSPIVSTGSKPAAPSLLSPADNAVSVAQDQYLEWAAVTYATSYRVEISRYSDFSLLQYYFGETMETSYLPPWTDVEGVKWYWRVCAANMAGYSSWSETRSFTR